MQKTVKISALLLGVAVLISNCPMNAKDTDEAIELTRGGKIVLGGLMPVVAAWMLLYWRKPEKNFESRFSAETAKKLSKFFTKEYMQNLWFGFYDEIIGQRQQSSALKAKEDKKVHFSEETPAYGVLGTLDARLAPIADAATKFTAPFFGSIALWNHLKKFAFKTDQHVKSVFKRNDAEAPVQTEDGGVSLVDPA